MKLLAATVFAASSAVGNLVKVVLKVNGATKTLEIDARVVLLDALCERLELTGSKQGCDQGQCGACTPGQICSAERTPWRNVPWGIGKNLP
jgi:aerobic-type carbon monoxide dehydrogenase small subunit (CoxS/CutS family)